MDAEEQRAMVLGLVAICSDIALAGEIVQALSMYKRAIVRQLKMYHADYYARRTTDHTKEVGRKEFLASPLPDWRLLDPLYPSHMGRWEAYYMERKDVRDVDGIVGRIKTIYMEIQDSLEILSSKDAITKYNGDMAKVEAEMARWRAVRDDKLDSCYLHRKLPLSELNLTAASTRSFTQIAAPMPNVAKPYRRLTPMEMESQKAIESFDGFTAGFYAISTRGESGSDYSSLYPDIITDGVTE